MAAFAVSYDVVCPDGIHENEVELVFACDEEDAADKVKLTSPLPILGVRWVERTDPKEWEA